MPRVPFVLAGDAQRKKPAWLNDAARTTTTAATSTSARAASTCFEQGDFFGLDDLFTEKPVVVERAGADLRGWIAATRSTASASTPPGTSNAAFFGVWVPQDPRGGRAGGRDRLRGLRRGVRSNDAVELSAYVRDRGLPNVLDFPFQDVGGALRGRERRREGSRRPARRRRLLPGAERRRADAADVPRQPRHGPRGAADPGAQAPERRRGSCSAARPARLRPALPAARRAGRCYYGDEVGIDRLAAATSRRARTVPDAGRRSGRRRSASARRRSARARRSTVTANPVAAQLRTLVRAAGRASRALDGLVGRALRAGRRARRLAASTSPAAARYVVAFNSGTTAARVTVPTSTPVRPWSIASASRHATPGGLALTIRPGLRRAAACRAPRSRDAGRPPRRSRPSADDLTDLVAALAPTSAARPRRVTFASRRDGRPWRRVGVDDSPPYRAFLDPGAYRRKRARGLRCRRARRRRHDRGLQGRPVMPNPDGPDARPKGRDAAVAAVTVEGGVPDVQPPPGSPVAAARPHARVRARVRHAARRRRRQRSRATCSRSSAAPATGIPDCAATHLPTTRPTASGSAPSPCRPATGSTRRR